MKIQSYAIPDCQTLDHFLAWYGMLSQNMATLGYVQQNDTDQIQFPAFSARIMRARDNGDGTVTYTYDKLSGGTFAVNQRVVISDCRTTAFDTKLAVTKFIQQIDETISLTQAIRQTSQSFTITSATISGVSLVCNGTITGGGSNAFANWAFTLAGFDNTVNNGTFMCTASTATTITFDVGSPVAETPSGTATAVSSSNTTAYLGAVGSGTSNGKQFYSFAVTGFLTGGNNYTADAIRRNIATTSTSFAITNASGANETHSGTSTSLANQAQLLGTITGGGSNAFTPFIIVTSGFATTRNNGSFACTSSSTVQLSITNRGGTNETPAAGAWAGMPATILAVTTTSATTGTIKISSSQIGNEAESGQGPFLAYAYVGPTCTIDHVASSGTTATYTYTGLTGTIRNGQRWTVLGTSTNSGGFNQTGLITNLNTGAHTFQIVGNNNGSIGTTSDSGVATAASLSEVPGNQGSTTFVGKTSLYEMWKSNDGLTPYYIKFLYTIGAGPAPGLGIHIGTATDGAGSFIGAQTEREYVTYGAATVAGFQSRYFENNFYGSGNGSSIAMQYHRDAVSSSFLPGYFAVERTKSSAGADTNLGVTLLIARPPNTAASSVTLSLQTSYSFPITSVNSDASPTWTGTFTGGANAAYQGYIVVITGFTNEVNNGVFLITGSSVTNITASADQITVAESASATATIYTGIKDINFGTINRVNALPISWMAGNNIVASPVLPNLGYFGNPLKNTVVSVVNDTNDGQLIKISIGGTQHTYLFMATQAAAYAGGAGATSSVGILWE